MIPGFPADRLGHGQRNSATSHVHGYWTCCDIITSVIVAGRMQAQPVKDLLL